MHTEYQCPGPSDAEKTAWIEDGRALLHPVAHELGSGCDLTYVERNEPAARR